MCRNFWTPLWQAAARDGAVRAAVRRAQMRRAIVLVAALGASVGVAVGASGQATAGPTPPSQVFFVPHQDDEVLSLGAQIVNAVDRGDDVRVVITHDGTASGARANLCKAKNICLTVEEFGQARYDEFAASVQLLGVPADRVYDWHLPEGKSSPEMVQTQMAAFVTKFGLNSSYHTLSWLDAHQDHYSLGYALDALTRTFDRLDAHFYQSDLYNPGAGLTHWIYPKVATPPGQWVRVEGSAQQRLLAAMDEYRRFEPENKRYGIGWLWSVPPYFEYAIKRTEDWVHGPSSTWDDDAAQQKAAEFAEKFQPFRPGAPRPLRSIEPLPPQTYTHPDGTTIVLDEH